MDYQEIKYYDEIRKLSLRFKQNINASIKNKAMLSLNMMI